MFQDVWKLAALYMRMVIQDAYSKGKSGKGICPHMFRHDSLCGSLVMLFSCSIWRVCLECVPTEDAFLKMACISFRQKSERTLYRVYAQLNDLERFIHIEHYEHCESIHTALTLRAQLCIPGVQRIPWSHQRPHLHLVLHRGGPLGKALGGSREFQVYAEV